MAATVHSFAVFDTCLARLYARPTDLFFELASRALPPPRTREDMHELVRLRLAAQADAVRKLKLEAAGLGLVYEHFPADNPWGLDPHDLLSTEQDLVTSSVVPVASVLEEVRALARRGERVVYVTDSLLPGQAIRRLMESHGFAGEVYCAGDTGKAKATGTLYKTVLAAEGVLAQELTHRGPDQQADVAAPKALGVRVNPFEQARLTRHEARLLSLHHDCKPSLSRIVGASRVARLATPCDAGLAGFRALAADVVGPALAGFVAWALAEAGRAGVERLFFLAREGQILFKLAQVLAPAVGGPEPRYLLGSLASWTAPGLSGLTRQDFEWLAGDETAATPQALLARLSLTQGELALAAGSQPPELFDTGPLDQARRDALWRVLDTPAVRALMTVKASEERKLLLDYLEQEGALASPVMAVADMGWTLFTQRALRMALEDRGVEVTGWYFGLTSRRLGRMEAGPHRALFIERAAQAAPGSLDSLLFRHIALLERVFTRAAHGRVQGYRRAGGGVHPVLGPSPGAPEQIALVHDTALAFAKGLAGQGWGEEVLAALKETAGQSLRTFLAAPDADMARAVACVPVEPGQPLLCRPVSSAEAARAWLAARTGLSLSAADAPLWLAGSLAMSRGWVRALARSAQGERIFGNYFSARG